MAETMAEADPGHGDLYRANAEMAIDRLSDQEARIAKALQPVREKPYVVFHDAYQYFERHFDLHPIGSVSLGDADRPGPVRLLQLRDTIAESGAVCIFAEPQFSPDLIDMLSEEASVKTGVLDPIGADLEPGPGLYPELIDGLVDGLLRCLG